MSNNQTKQRFPTTFNRNRAQAEAAALLIAFDDTVEAKLTESQQFANFQRKLAADRAAAKACFAEPKSTTEARKLNRLLATLSN